MLFRSIIVDAAVVNPYKYNPTIPLEVPTTMYRHSLLRKINVLLLRFPEFHSNRMDFSDLFEECARNLKKEDDKDYIYMEWLRIYQVLALNLKFLRTIFLSYNLNYLQRTGVRFIAESSHLERAFKMEFDTFKHLCKDMNVHLSNETLLYNYYISSRSYKKLPCKLHEQNS